MDMSFRKATSPLLDEIIEGLVGWDYEVTSELAWEYNCIAWAAGDDASIWWPGNRPDWYWPDGAPDEETVAAFVKAYETIGYHVCDDDSYDPGYDKIAIYVAEGGGPK